MHYYNKNGGMASEMLFTVIKTCWMPVLEKVRLGVPRRATRTTCRERGTSHLASHNSHVVARTRARPRRTRARATRAQAGVSPENPLLRSSMGMGAGFRS